MNVAMLDALLNHRILTARSREACRRWWGVKNRAKALLVVSPDTERLASRMLHLLTAHETTHLRAA